MEYTGSVYVGIVGPENELGECRDSIERIVRRPGDSMLRFARATKGYEARQMHLNTWYAEGKHEFLLLLDHDMRFEPDTLERLRNHKKPFISGYYVRRQFGPMIPIWFRPYRGSFPLEPWMGVPERGRLHKIGASGWGVMLMHRDVVTATKPLLKGEDEIIEDDMDIWPYDLGRVMDALNGLRELVEDKPKMRTLRPALAAHLATLEEEIRPLRGVKSVVGSDIRFPFFAKQAGFQLWGDPNVAPAHMLNYPLTVLDYAGLPDDLMQEGIKNIRAHVLRERRGIKKTLEGFNG